MNPRVSVVMANRNYGRYLAEAVGSIAAQNMPEWELIVIEDFSTDQSRQLLARLSVGEPRIKVIQNRLRKGYATSLNAGIERCRGEWIAILDADDRSFPARLRTQLAHAKNDPELVLIGSEAELINDSGRVIKKHLGLPLRHEEILEFLLQAKWPLIHSSCMMRKSAMIEVGGYDTQLSRQIDHDMYLKLSDLGRLTNLGEALVQYRLHGLSTTAAGAESQLPAIISAACQRRGVSFPYQGGAICKSFDHQSYRLSQTLSYRELLAMFMRSPAANTRLFVRVFLIKSRCEVILRGYRMLKSWATTERSGLHARRIMEAVRRSVAAKPRS